MHNIVYAILLQAFKKGEELQENQRRQNI